MNENEIFVYKTRTVRILKIINERILVIDCDKRNMPFWIEENDFKTKATKKIINKEEGLISDYESLNVDQKKFINEIFGTISFIIPVIEDDVERNRLIKFSAKKYKVAVETIKRRLCNYLAANDKLCFLRGVQNKRELTNDEKNFRWILNKYFYSSISLSLRDTYRKLLKEKYLDINGKLLENYPSFRQFNYYFYKNDRDVKRIISREGKGEFLRNHRVLLGSGIKDFCTTIGFGMVDSTVCDIYLVNECGQLVGRPILTACVDGYSGLCMGYSLGFEGGTNSLIKLVNNICTNKVDWCRKFNFEIEESMWDCDKLPHKFITDKGREYIGETFSRLTNLGIEIINLPPYRPELKGRVEKFFDIVQNFYKKELVYKGVIFEDFQERGGIDYRKRACLTIDQFEQIILMCIVHYNTNKMIDLPLDKVGKVDTFSYSLWNSCLGACGGTLIDVDKEILRLTLLSHTVGVFKREGLIVNKIRYRNKNFINRYLSGDEVEVAYDPNNLGKVWLYENGEYFEFEVIESFLMDKNMDEYSEIIKKKRDVEKSFEKKEIEGYIELSNVIGRIADSVGGKKIKIKNIRENRAKEIKKEKLEK